MSDSMKYLIDLFHLQTRLFNNVTAEIGDTEARQQMNANTNHIAWLTGHTVSTRFVLANVLGIEAAEPFPEFFGNRKGIDPGTKYPAMEALTADWNAISEKIAAALTSLPHEALGKKMPQPVPTGDTLGDFIAFIIHHEAYTIGQIGIARRYFGLEAMKYN